MLRVLPLESSLLRALAGQANTPPPIWLMRQAGRYLPEYRDVRAKVASFLDLCRTPELAAEVTLQPLRRFALDAAIVFSDILIVPYALGQQVEVCRGRRPTARANSRREGGGCAQSGCMPKMPWRQFTRLSSEWSASFRQKCPLIGFCGAPWTVATYMVEGGGSKDQAAARLMAYRQPATFERLIDLLVEVSADYLLNQVKAGAGVPADLRQLGREPAGGRVCALVHRADQAAGRAGQGQGAADPRDRLSARRGPPCRTLCAERPASTPSAATQACRSRWIRDKLQPLLPVQGNLDPALLAAGGPELDRRVRLDPRPHLPRVPSSSISVTASCPTRPSLMSRGLSRL